MKFWVGVTDNNWFKYLSEIQPDEVNFWQPSATPPFKAAPIGMPFLFKLKRPFNHIAGGGFFVTYSRLPLSVAWEVFEEKNGCSSLENLRSLIHPLISGGIRDGDIGCTVLANPFFLARTNWLNDPPGWSSNIVRGKMYDTTENAGREIWESVQSTIALRPNEPFQSHEGVTTAEQLPKYGGQDLDNHLSEYWSQKHTSGVVQLRGRVL